jgi:hypothetical protein
MRLLATRAALSVGLAKGGVPAAAARCMAGRMVDMWTADELNSPTFATDDPATQTRLQAMAVACR